MPCLVMQVIIAAKQFTEELNYNNLSPTKQEIAVSEEKL